MALGMVYNPLTSPNNPNGPGSTGSSGTMASTQAAGQLIPGELANQLSNQQFYGSLLPEQHAAIGHLVNLLQNPDQASDEYRNFVMGQVQQHLPELYNHLQSTGAGIGSAQGSLLSGINQGATTANQFSSQQYSPTGIQQRGQAVLGLTSGAAPSYSGLGELGQIQHPPTTPDNTLSQVGSVLGGLGSLLNL